MIDYHTFCEIHRLRDQEHLTLAQIATRLQVAYPTVQKWARRATFQKARTPKRPSKLDPFKGVIVASLGRHPYTAQQILQQLRTQGYAGGYSILKEFVRQVRPVRRPAFLRLEFGPGECAQVDWGSFGSIPVGSTRRRLSFFLMVLCHSRLLYLEFTLSEGMEQFLTCHRHALEFVGAVPARVMIDNLKVGVLQHPLGQNAQFHPRYLDFAAHYGFQPVACTVKRANEKGRVESGVGYVKKNFLHGLDIPGFAALHPAARHWLDTVANVRLHGETRRQPQEHFAEEKPHLKPLPVIPYDCAVIRPSGANRCCRVVLDTNRYTVPPLYASQKLSLKIYPDQLLVYHHEKLTPTSAAMIATRTSAIPITSRTCSPSARKPATRPCCWPSSTSVPRPTFTCANFRTNASTPLTTSRRSSPWAKSTAPTRSPGRSRTPSPSRPTAASTLPTSSNNANGCPSLLPPSI